MPVFMKRFSDADAKHEEFRIMQAAGTHTRIQHDKPLPSVALRLGVVATRPTGLSETLLKFLPQACRCHSKRVTVFCVFEQTTEVVPKVWSNAVDMYVLCRHSDLQVLDRARAACERLAWRNQAKV